MRFRVSGCADRARGGGGSLRDFAPRQDRKARDDFGSKPFATAPARYALASADNRPQIAFCRVNASGSASYDPSLQRHHLLPRQLLSTRCFNSLFEHVGRRRVGFDDFRANGLLLPATEAATRRTGMPLHRGPHRRYNELVMERVGCIEAGWIEAHRTDPEAARTEALMRLRLLQIALRRRLLDERRRMVLNRKDPLGTGFDFTELDAMAEALWASTGT